MLAEKDSPLGESGNARHSFQAATHAERYGFVAVVPEGGVSKAKSGFSWNTNTLGEPNEVAFMHTLVSSVVAEHSIGGDKPKIMLGFSGGAAMASLLGCADSTHIYAAAVCTR